jgi:hypothetical protein
MYCNASNRRKPLLFKLLGHKLYSSCNKSFIKLGSACPEIKIFEVYAYLLEIR